MSLFGIGSPSGALALPGLGSRSAAPAPAIGGGTPIPGNGAFAGGYMAQGAGSNAGSLLKKVLIGGIAGAGVGAGYGVLSSMVGFLPGVSIGLGAMIGAGAGAALALAKGLLDIRKGKLAMQRAIQPGAGMNPATGAIPIPRPLKGKTYSIGSQGPHVRWTQRTLKRLGLYRGKVTGKLDRQTAEAIRKYELLKGALPTGQSTPDLRASLHQDVRLSRELAR